MPWTWEGGRGGPTDTQVFFFFFFGGLYNDVGHTMALPFTLKSTLRKNKKNYENSNIAPYKIYNLLQKNSFKRNPKNPSRYIIIL